MSYSLTFFTPSGLIEITNEGTIKLTQQHQPVALSPEELAVIANFSKCLKNLQNGKFVDYDFDPKSLEDKDEVVKCEWMRSGILKFRGPATIKYNFRDTLTFATDPIETPRVFTCARSLYNELPKRRESRKKANV